MTARWATSVLRGFQHIGSQQHRTAWPRAASGRNMSAAASPDPHTHARTHTHTAGAHAHPHAHPAVHTPLSVLTYNLLSPGYFRKNERTGRKKMEASHREAWSPRLRQQFRVCADVCADVCALQELWFKKDVFDMLHAALGREYDVIHAQRTGSKEDGVALLVRRGRWRVCRSRARAFADAGDRVMAMALLQSVDAPCAFVMVIATHLTYPHDAYDLELRLAQAETICEEALHFAGACADVTGHRAGAGSSGAAESMPGVGTDALVEHAPLHTAVPVVIAGDFNHVDDAAMSHFRAQGYKSGFAVITGRDARITHIDHAGGQQGVDFVLYKTLPLRTGKGPSSALEPPPRIVPTAATLLPAGVPDTTSMKRPVVQLAPEVLASIQSSREYPDEPSSKTASSVPAALASSAMAAAPTARVPISSSARQFGTTTPSSASSTGSAALSASEPAPFLGAFSVERGLSDLTFADYCNLSDHRPLLVQFDVISEGT